MTEEPLRIGVVAGEASGDLLGEGLIQAIRVRHPEAQTQGICGPAMLGAGCVSHYPMERLSVMGLVEVVGRLSELVRQRRGLARTLRAWRPDVFVGVDSPDYNLGLEGRLKAAGIPTVHYVSPSVWAWRQYRIRKIAEVIDLVLALFPFEADYYRRHEVPVKFVGHPLADAIALETDRSAARARLGIAAEGEVVALLPGSRSSEVERLARPMLGAAQWLLQRRAGLRFVVPLVSAATRRLFRDALGRVGGSLPLTEVEGRSREVMAASDVVLLASGTATLEAMLIKRPMVVTYRVIPVTAWVARRLVTVQHYAIPNLLAGRNLVPELIQEQAVPEQLGAAVLQYLEEPGRARAVMDEFTRLHRLLRRGASDRAAEAVLSLIGR
jgi:lipid-A-disaccharide synthase